MRNRGHNESPHNASQVFLSYLRSHSCIHSVSVRKQNTQRVVDGLLLSITTMEYTGRILYKQQRFALDQSSGPPLVMEVTEPKAAHDT